MCTRTRLGRGLNSTIFGGNGPPPPPTKGTVVGNNEMCRWENLDGPFLVHTLFWVPDPPPPQHPLLIQAWPGAGPGAGHWVGLGLGPRRRRCPTACAPFPPGEIKFCKRKESFGPFLEHKPSNPRPPPHSKPSPPPPPVNREESLWLLEAPVREVILQMHTPARTSQCWSRQTPAWTRSVRLDAPGQRHGQQPVSGTADPRSCQTGQVIRGLR